MQEIASAIQIGAKAYLNRQYKTIAVVGFIVLLIVSYFFSYLVGLGYFIGDFLSGVAGYVGMLISVQANVRTAEASRTSLQKGLTMADVVKTLIEDYVFVNTEGLDQSTEIINTQVEDDWRSEL